jgi:hypothetical protein
VLFLQLTAVPNLQLQAKVMQAPAGRLSCCRHSCTGASGVMQAASTQLGCKRVSGLEVRTWGCNRTRRSAGKMLQLLAGLLKVLALLHHRKRRQAGCEHPFRVLVGAQGL